MADDRNEAFEEALDAWRAEMAASVASSCQFSRDEALMVLAADALVGMGLLDPRNSIGAQA